MLLKLHAVYYISIFDANLICMLFQIVATILHDVSDNDFLVNGCGAPTQCFGASKHDQHAFIQKLQTFFQKIFHQGNCLTKVLSV